MRFARDITERVNVKDPDGYADLVIIEFAVNDWGEPSKCRCFESMVKEVLEQPNEPAVILLFSMRDDGWNLQGDLRKIGDRYDLMMVSVPDGLYRHVGKEITKKDFFYVTARETEVGNKLSALKDALAGAVTEGKMSEEELNAVRKLHREAQWYFDFCYVENSEGAGPMKRKRRDC